MTRRSKANTRRKRRYNCRNARHNSRHNHRLSRNNGVQSSATRKRVCCTNIKSPQSTLRLNKRVLRNKRCGGDIMDKLITVHQQSHPYMTPEQCCAYALPYPNREHTYFVFEKIYDHTMFGKPKLVELNKLDSGQPDLYNNRWFCLPQIMMRHFSTGGGDNKFHKFTKKHNDVYMACVVEIDASSTIEQWFITNKIDSSQLHITMMAFVVPMTEHLDTYLHTASTESTTQEPFAVHFYIQKWTTIRGLSIPLHGFSATIIQQKIIQNDNLFICSSPNNTMYSILERDVRRKRSFYQTSTTDHSLYNNILEAANFNVKFRNFGIQSNGTSITIRAKRLAQRFRGFYDSTENAFRAGDLYFYVMGSKPPSTKTDDELLKDVYSFFYDKLSSDSTPAIFWKHECEEAIRIIETLISRSASMFHLTSQHINVLVSKKWLNLLPPIYTAAYDKLLEENVEECIIISLQQEYNLHSTLQDTFEGQEEVQCMKGHQFEKELLYALKQLKYIYEKRKQIFEGEPDTTQHYRYPEKARHFIDALTKIQENIEWDNKRKYFNFLKDKLLSAYRDMIYGSTYIHNLTDNLTVDQRIQCCVKVIQTIQDCINDSEE